MCGVADTTVISAAISACLSSSTRFFPAECCGGGEARSGEPMRGPEVIRKAPPSFALALLSDDAVITEEQCASSRCGVVGVAAITNAVSSSAVAAVLWQPSFEAPGV